MNEQQEQFLQTLDGEPSAEQLAQLLELGEGDTGTKVLEGEVLPGASTGDADDKSTDAAGKSEEDKKADDAAAAAVDPDPANTVILAKDGVHTIEYQKLVDAREAEKQAKALLDAANDTIAALKAEAEQRAAAGAAATVVDKQVAVADAAIAAGVDASLFGDFSEEALSKGIQALVDQKLAAALAPVEARLAPIQQQQQVDANQAHYDSIYAKHPDADSIAESKELTDWIATQPSFVRDGYTNVLSKGTAAQVIEMFDTFKQATGKAQVSDEAANAAALKSKAKEAISSATARVPASLSDIPGGKVGATSAFDAMADSDNGAELLDSMQSWTPEQIETFLNRNV